MAINIKQTFKQVGNLTTKLPTIFRKNLCDLTQIEKPNFISGKSLLPILKNPKTEGRFAVSYTDKANTIKTKEYRLITHKNGGVELYNHLVDPNETTNIATQQPEMVTKLKKMLADKLVSKMSFL
jgi:iduronate 2-sulfatase